MAEPLRHYVQGNKDSKTLLVFLQGWPDNKVVWDWINWKDQLVDSQILFVDFPNTAGQDVDLKWGQDFPVITERLRATLSQFDNVENKILIAHDWGCTYGYIFDKAYPKYFNQMITMDVPAYVQLKTISQKLMVVAYQLYLVIAFMLGGIAGKKMTQSLAKLFKHNPPYFDQLNSSRNYPYYYFWKNMLKSTFNKNNLYLSRYTPSVPVVYLYGTKKPFQFHGQKWMTHLARTEGCEVQSFDAGHWFMKKYSKFITELIKRRIVAKL